MRTIEKFEKQLNKKLEALTYDDLLAIMQDEKYKEFLELSDKNYDSHTYWWKGWCNSDTEEKTEISFISSSGRNISKYPLPTEEDISHSKPRRFSMHKRLLSLIAKL